MLRVGSGVGVPLYGGACWYTILLSRTCMKAVFLPFLSFTYVCSLLKRYKYTSTLFKGYDPAPVRRVTSRLPSSFRASLRLRHSDLRTDNLLVNPPFNISDRGGDRLRDRRRWQYGVPPTGNANFA